MIFIQKTPTNKVERHLQKIAAFSDFVKIKVFFPKKTIDFSKKNQILNVLRNLFFQSHSKGKFATI